jgi:hypothetical protein
MLPNNLKAVEFSTFLVINRLYQRFIEVSSYPEEEDIGKIMLPITILALALLLSSCATPNPLAPYSAGADGLVMLENLCEDPIEDFQTLIYI